jgi:hypothetical protein
MEYGGKIANRFWMPKQIGTDDAMADEIRATSAVDRRPLREQIRFLITLGIEYRRIQLSKGLIPQSEHSREQLRTSQNSSQSQTHTRPHKDAQLPNQLLLPNTAGPIPTRKRRIA